MTRRVLGVVLVAVLVVLAGCGGGAVDPATSSDSSDGGASGGGTATDESAGESGAISFYVSDQPNAIEEFEHLNVTITKVGMHRVGGNDSETDTPTPENDTETSTPGNDTETPTPGNDTASATEEREDEESEDGEWIEHEVTATVDLTELVGANATKLDVLEAPAGTYDKVFVSVESVDATLNSGEDVRVKLPSGKLQLNEQFEVGGGDDISFVFDIAVHEAGNSGKYVLKPVVSESGTGDEVDIEDVDEALGVEFVGPVEPGSEATVKVTGEDGPVAGATVEVNDAVVGETDADGTLAFDVAADAEKIEVSVRAGDREGELEREFEEDEDGDDQGGDDDRSGDPGQGADEDQGDGGGDSGNDALVRPIT